MSFANSDRSVSRGESLLLSQAKTIIIGDSTVGKSSIIWRFLSKEFKLNTPPTVGKIKTFFYISLNSMKRT